MLFIIPYTKEYASCVSQLFHDAIHAIDDDVYSVLHQQAWSKAPRSNYHWQKRLSNSQTWLMLDDTQLYQARPRCCGFINVEIGYVSRGYIDSLYVHPNYQHRGIATRLYLCLQDWASAQGFTRLSVDASVLSKPLFLSQGFKQVHRSYQEKSGQVIMGFLMEKGLQP
ncbi:GNAT family N-acetyltransferase [Shewanella surugensis]|uniref:GNAT family N-acetyltransferase n=1 Tax=Shewanella surugensis TaxID=212020 RepID=A0ABT0LBK2_9GAMM|nr:GNAT family N-acetyltransferase [Shewanella surugensis]MCL1125015.1 GNAT family N-acetyltransferase [Shewanella surugensis]